MRAVLYVLIMGLMLMGIACTSLAVILSISLARTGNPRPRWTWPVPWCRGLAAAALLLALLPVGGLLLLPTGESSTVTSSDVGSTGVTSIDGATVTSSQGSGGGSVQVTTSTESSTLIDNEGGSVLWVLAIPVILTGLGTAIRGRGEHAVRLVCGWVLFAGSIVAMASVGLLFLPAASVLTIAGALTPSARSARRQAAEIPA